MIVFQSPHNTYDTLLPALAELGYDGVELPLKAILFYGKDKFRRLLAKTGLRVIVMAMTDGPVAPGCGMLWGGPYPGFSAPPFPGKHYICIRGGAGYLTFLQWMG